MTSPPHDWRSESPAPRDPYGAPPPPPVPFASSGQPPAGYPYPQWPAVPAYGYGPPVPSPSASGMYVAAAVINWVVLGLLVLLTCGIGIVAAAWFVPMTVFIHKGARDRDKHTALGICTLLFCNIVSGILILVEDSNR